LSLKLSVGQFVGHILERRYTAQFDRISVA
jgi:hypothetical protein